MRTQPLREDKHCLNCGAEVPERFCTHCGQENTERHESFTHLLQHFVADVVHYDSQFLKTLKYLLFRPGRLTSEYIAGRRVAYVNPIKLYIFISFVFFLTYAFLNPVSHGSEGHGAKTYSEVRDSVSQALKNKGLHMELSSEDSALLRGDPLMEALDKYKSLHEYDSVQATLPPSERKGFWKRLLIRRALYFRGNDDTKDSMGELFQHNLPKLMFILLPLFALLLKLFYRRNKRWLYADHAIFSLHVHSFSFVLLLVSFTLDHYLNTSQFSNWATLIILFYLVRALKYVYGQSTLKSVVKGVLLSMAYLALMAIVFAVFGFLALAIFL